MRINHLIMLRLFLFDIMVSAELIVLYTKMPGFTSLSDTDKFLNSTEENMKQTKLCQLL